MRTLLEKGKLDSIKKKIKRMNVNIMGLCVVRWTGAGSIVSDSCKTIYSAEGDKPERGVAVIMDLPTSRTLKGYLTLADRVMQVRLKGSFFDATIIQAYAPTSECTEEEIEKFCDEINQAKTHCKSQDIVIVMGDFKGKVGTTRHEDIVGPYGLGTRNERGEKLIEWVILNDIIIIGITKKIMDLEEESWRQRSQPERLYHNQ
ncbi:craniofacial development protein 2-like [Aplysia californica]|uniref:Craniofacial development protein 2-like n=1 Tax=Aplysia californica TaxID=6500 RepID=A0ABM1A788_APLCA|nr:craniofacial development protein 2-like [Aplysia californica]